METNTAPTPPQPDQSTAPQITNKHKGKWLVAGIVVVALLASGAWVMLGRQSESKDVKTAAGSPTPAATATPLPGRLMYAVADTRGSDAMGRVLRRVMESKVTPETYTSDLFNALLGSSVAPDGSLAYATWSGEGQNSIYSLEYVKADGTKSKLLTLPKGKTINAVALSADGQQIAYWLMSWQTDKSASEIWTIKSDGTGNTKVLADTTYPEKSIYSLSPAQWSSDKKYLLLEPGSIGTDAPLPSTIYRLELATGKVTVAAKIATSGWRLVNYSYSPDGAKVAYTETTNAAPGPDQMIGDVKNSALRVVDIATGKTTTLKEEANDTWAGGLAWSPDSQSLALSKDGQVLTLSASGGTPTKATFTLNKDYHLDHLLWVGDHIIYVVNGVYEGQKSELRVMDVDGANNTLIETAAHVHLMGAVN